MKLRVLSDLHLEYSVITIHPSIEDVLVLAGDISPDRTQVISLIETYISHPDYKGQYVILVLGNHDYYCFSENFDDADDGKKDFIQQTDLFYKNFYEKHEKIFVLQNESVRINDIYFYGTTLWTNIPKIYENHIFLSMNDYNYIPNFTPSISTEIHKKAVSFLQEFLESLKEDDKVVLITHHLPTFSSIHEKYREYKSINHAFASELDEQLSNPRIKLVIHGHTHSTLDYIHSKGKRIICNPRGYTKTSKSIPENSNFELVKIVEIN